MTFYHVAAAPNRISSVEFGSVLIITGVGPQARINRRLLLSDLQNKEGPVIL